jgi:hypothetical protein
LVKWDHTFDFGLLFGIEMGIDIAGSQHLRAKRWALNCSGRDCGR